MFAALSGAQSQFLRNSFVFVIRTWSNSAKTPRTAVGGIKPGGLLQPPPFELTLNRLSPLAGAYKRKLRVGRGIGTGVGKTAGRGTKGQKARHFVNVGFEGGQTTVAKRLGKHGFVNIHATKYDYISLLRLQTFINAGRLNPAAPINMKTLVDVGALTRVSQHGGGVKILGTGKDVFTAKINIEAARASKSAIEAIEKAGGKFTAVYHNRLGIRAIMFPEKFTILPRQARPNTPKKLAYYRNPENRGYLAHELTDGTVAPAAESSATVTAPAATAAAASTTAKK